jgi:hypothetical protein
MKKILSDQTLSDMAENTELKIENIYLAIENNKLTAKNIDLRQRQPPGTSPRGTSSQGVWTQPLERTPRTLEDDPWWNLIQVENEKLRGKLKGLESENANLRSVIKATRLENTALKGKNTNLIKLQGTSLQEIEDKTQKNQTLDAQNAKLTKLQESHLQETNDGILNAKTLNNWLFKDIKNTEAENKTLRMNKVNLAKQSTHAQFPCILSKRS